MFRFISTKIAEFRMWKAQKELEKSDVTMEDIYKFNRTKRAVFDDGASWDEVINREFGDDEIKDLHIEEE